MMPLQRNKNTAMTTMRQKCAIDTVKGRNKTNRRLARSKQQGNAGQFKPFILSELPSTLNECRQYYVLGVLGTGDTAVVFEAVIVGNAYKGRKVALKGLKGRKENLVEVEIQLGLHHPNIVEFLGSFISYGFTFIVLDLCQNKSLDHMVRSRGYLTEPEVRAYTIQLAGGIKFLHSKGIIHRDLKLQNIGLDVNMNIKIGDFGLAARLQSQESRLSERCGTKTYMAPEVLEHDGHGYDQRVDIWSLGVIIYKMLAGSSAHFQGIDRLCCNLDQLSEGARNLVGSLLVQASDRLPLDEIVKHPFIAKGSYLEKISSTFLTSAPIRPRHGPVRDAAIFQHYCQLAGIGTDDNGDFWPCVGKEEYANAIRNQREGIWTTLGFEWAPLSN